MKTMRLSWKSYTVRFVILTYAISWMFFSPLLWGYYINDYRQGSYQKFLMDFYIHSEGWFLWGQETYVKNN
jgi:hypothetical protein